MPTDQTVPQLLEEARIWIADYHRSLREGGRPALGLGIVNNYEQIANRLAAYEKHLRWISGLGVRHASVEVTTSTKRMLAASVSSLVEKP